MTPFHLLGAVVAVALLVYLGIALFNAEDL
jgi:K+-transporting ATPase KdpF subunit